GAFSISESGSSICLVFVPPPPQKAIWDGEGADALWDSAANWVGNVVPDPASNATFYIGLGSGANINLHGDRTVAGLTFNDGADTALNIRSNTLTINGQGIMISTGAAGAHIISAGVYLGATQVWDNSSMRTLTVSGAISGPGGIRKQGEGQVNLTSSANGVWGGGLWVDAGTLYSLYGTGYRSNAVVNVGTNALLDLYNGSAWGSWTPVIVNLFGTNTTTKGSLKLTGNSCFWDGCGINLFTNTMMVVNGVVYMRSGSMDLNGYTLYLDTPGSFLMEGGAINNASRLSDDGAIYKTGAGYFQLATHAGMTGSIHILAGSFGHHTATALPAGGLLTFEDGTTYRARGAGANVYCSKAARINGNIQLGSVVGDIYMSGPVDLNGGVRTLTAGRNATLSHTITNGGIIKEGSYWMELSGTNSYQGGTQVKNGILYGRTYSLQGNIQNDTVVSFFQAESGTFFGVISGTGTVWKESTGQVVFSGSNTYSGITDVRGGILTITHAEALGVSASAVTVSNGASLRLGGGIVTPAKPLMLLGNGYDGGGALDNISSNNTYAGPITLMAHTRIRSQADMLNVNGSITGAGFNLETCGSGTIRIFSSLDLLATGAVRKIDAGILILEGSSTNSGGTVVSAGTLIQNGTNTVAPVTTASGATLMGAGRAGVVYIGGVLWPGSSTSSIGSLRVASLTMSNNAALRVRIGNCTDTTDRDYVINDGAATISAMVKVQPDSSRISNWDSDLDYQWVIITNGITDTNNFTLDETLWDELVYSKVGGEFTLSASNGNLVLSYVAGFAAGIIVMGTNNAAIPHGDMIPSLADGTDFGDVHVSTGSPVTHIFTITNSGNADLVLTNVTMGGTHPGDFTVTNQPAWTLAPGTKGYFHIQFDPSAVGTRSATVYITNNVPGKTPYAFALQGTGVWPGISVRGTWWDSKNLGDPPYTNRMGVTNCGNGTLNYTLATNANWLTCSPASGSLGQGQGLQHTNVINTYGLGIGTYTAVVTITDSSASNSPRVVTNWLNITALNVPTDIRAVPDGNEMVRLSWTKNVYQTILVTHRATNAPTAPSQWQTYADGDAIGGDGTRVVYKGTATNIEHVAGAGQTHYYAVYSDNNDCYSAGRGTQTTRAAYSYVIVEPGAYTNGVG
ncbi:MAG: choice-of-anchor D domain-containing protein, partial [Lentisphaerota bacterium]